MNAPLGFLQHHQRLNYGLRLLHPLAGYSQLLDPLTLASLSLSKNRQYQNGYYNSFVSSAEFPTDGYCSQHYGTSLSPKSMPTSDGDTSHGSGHQGLYLISSKITCSLWSQSIQCLSNSQTGGTFNSFNKYAQPNINPNIMAQYHNS